MNAMSVLLILCTLPVCCADQSPDEEEKQLGAALDMLKRCASLYSAAPSTEEEKQRGFPLDLLKRCAPNDHSLFAAGCIQKKEPFAVYRSVDKQRYEVSIYFNNKLYKIPVEQQTIEMNTPPCRHDECDTIQLALRLGEQVKYLCLTNKTSPSFACFGDEPKILSVHEPPPLKESAQVKLIELSKESFNHDLPIVHEPTISKESVQAELIEDSQKSCYDDWPIGN